MQMCPGFSVIYNGSILYFNKKDGSVRVKPEGNIWGVWSDGSESRKFNFLKTEQDFREFAEALAVLSGFRILEKSNDENNLVLELRGSAT